jgi:hypothetical protein
VWNAAATLATDLLEQNRGFHDYITVHEPRHTRRINHGSMF